MKLNELRDNPGATKSRKTRGAVARALAWARWAAAVSRARNPARGVAIKGYEGGQMPLYQRLPKRGFNKTETANPLRWSNLGLIQKFVDAGKLDAKAPITEDVLVESGPCSSQAGWCSGSGQGRYFGQAHPRSDRARRNPPSQRSRKAGWSTYRHGHGRRRIRGCPRRLGGLHILKFPIQRRRAGDTAPAAHA